MLTTYIVKGKDLGLQFLFKYDLKGVLVEFKKNDLLNDDQRLWLYSKVFPETEDLMKAWVLKLRQKFEVIKVPADLSFDNLWNQYNYKVSKEDAVKAFNKLKEPEIIKTFLSLKDYENHLLKTKVGKAHLSRYLNGKYFNNEY